MPTPDPDALMKAIVAGVTVAMKGARNKEEQKSAATKIVELIAESGTKVVVDQYREPYLVPPPEWLQSINSINPPQPMLNGSSEVKELHPDIRYDNVGNVGNVAPTELLVEGVEKLNKSYKNPTLPTLPTLPGRALSFTGDILEALIAKEYYKRFEKVPGPAAIRAALITIRGQHIATPSTEFWNRVGVDERGDWWLDLSDGRYVWITADGWDILEETPLYFRRHSYQLPLHTPTREGEGDLFSLLDFINLPDPDSQLLYLICALQCLIPDIPKAILNLTGAYGTIKSTGMGAIVELFDRTNMRDLPGGLLSMHENMKELVQNLDHHWVCYFDNLSGLDDEQSDALSRAVTGSAMEKRQLYSDDEDVARRFRRCVGFNSIGMIVSKTDLMSRSVVLETKPILKSQRKTDNEIKAKINVIAGKILGDAITVVARAKKMIDGGFTISEKPRMADFAVWGEALSQSMGFKPDTFLNAYYMNTKHAMEMVLRTNIVGGLLLDYLEDLFKTVTDISFSAHQLYTKLRVEAEEAHYNVKQDFPGNPSKLGVVIREIQPNLPSQGIRCTIKREGRGMKYYFTRFIPTKIDESYDAAAGHGVNSWAVDDLRKLRDQLKGFKDEAPVPVPVVEPISKESVGLGFAREALLGQFRGEPLKDEDAIAFLGKLGLPVSRAVMIIASMMRDGVIFSARPGWYQLSSSGERIA